MPDNTALQGTQTPSSGSSEYNALVFLVRQILSQRHSVGLGQIVAVQNTGGVSPVGFVDVLPLVNQLDGTGSPVPHGVLHNLPYVRLQGGGNAVIMDPQVGDIGLCVFADRDISAVKTSRKQANPGSMRQCDMADGVYLGGLLNGTPTQYVQFSAAGIKLHSPVAVLLEAPNVQVDAATFTVNASGAVGINAGGGATVTAPTFTVNGATVLNGDTAINGGISQGAGGSGGTASLIGPLNVTNDVVAGGVSLKTHRHTSGVVGAPTSTPIP